jgi:hypothetical protein
MDPGRWCTNYIQNYVERDVRALLQISSLSSFPVPTRNHSLFTAVRKHSPMTAAG